MITKCKMLLKEISNFRAKISRRRKQENMERQAPGRLLAPVT